MAKKQIKNYVFKPGIGSSGNKFPGAYELLAINKAFIQKEATAWIQDQVLAGTSGFVGYTYNSSKCERDVGYIVDAYLYDIRYGGNSKTYKYTSYYWDQDVAQVDGDRVPEIETHTFLRSLIRDYIFTNTEYTASNVEITQLFDVSKTAEAGAITKFEELNDIVVAVIQNGLSSLPELEPTGVGTVKIQGRYNTNELLLITDTTVNEIIYNFSDSTKGGEVSTVTVEQDDDFPSYLQTTDAVTQISLKHDTSALSSTHDLQIFVEEAEARVRPYDFGTDAIERMRMAAPLSMLDADFEYGLQPTKWAAISTMRGYPSVYEIPGTDTEVISVVTDASVGSGGIGQSLITVTTVSAHGFEIGTPITIKALEDAVVGANRAEGSFVITGVPDSTSFTYYAKAKVGTANGDVLSTNYTQLREAGFYTGASIGSNPEFNVLSNGTNGTMVSQLINPPGTTILAYDGQSPEVGAPLTHEFGNLPTGTQVTGVIDQSQGGGTYITPILIGDYNVGDNVFTVENAAGVVPNLALDRGDGYAMYLQNIDGNQLTFSGGLTTGKLGNKTTYTNVEGQNIPGNGSGAEFTISRANGTYTVDATTNAGTNYAVGDRLIVAGIQLDGLDPDNNLILRVTSTAQIDGSITGIVVDTGVAVDGTGTYNGITPTVNGNNGTGARFNITYENNSYTSVTLNTDTTTSSGFIENDRLQIDGTAMGPLGVTITNDLIIKVLSVDPATGEILTFSTEGVAPNAQVEYNQPNYGTSGTGSGIVFNVIRIGTSYTFAFSTENGSRGVDFVPGDTITVTGDLLGGVTPTNDCVTTVNTVNPDGSIATITTVGTAVNTETLFDVFAGQLQGNGAIFDISYAANAYTVNLSNGGTNYSTGQTFSIAGTTLGGRSPEDDIEITIDSVSTEGAITAYSFIGTPLPVLDTYTGIQPPNETPQGSLGSFDIVRESGTYSSITLATNGSDYAVGNRILIPGGQMGGQSPENDILITVTGATSGGITTFTTDFVSATSGEDFDLISTVLITEASTGLINIGDEISYSALATIEVTFGSPHGLVPGDTFIVSNLSDDGLNNHSLTSGAFIANSIGDINKLSYTAKTAGFIDTTGSVINGEVYPRPDSFFIHRPFDGGVQLGTGGPQHGAQAIRQSKKYIRYQSGKGIMYTTGALFAPSYDLRSVSAEGLEVGDLITITTDDNDHGVQVGGYIRLIGIETPGYNSGPETAVPPEFDYEVVQVVDERTFKVRAQRRLGSGTMFGDWRLTEDWSSRFNYVTHPNLNRITFRNTDLNGNTTPTLILEALTDEDRQTLQSLLTINDLAVTGSIIVAGTVTTNGGSSTYEVDSLFNYQTIQTDGLRQLAIVGLSDNEDGDGNPLSTWSDFDFIDSGASTPGDQPADIVDDNITILKFGKPGYFATLGFGAQMSVVQWHGATVRSGIFDDQNGIFWEFDGTNISAVQRTGTRQLAGTLSVNVDGNTVIGSNTRFRDQLVAGDRIIIKGMTHVVSHVISQSQITITPDWRGVVDITGAKANLIVDKKVKQSEFNLDRLDGTGPSGYDIDPAKMQMIGIQYSWYGAGFIDFMLRGQDGNFIFCHRMRNSNVNTEAFMRSGNLPVRYEVTNEGPPGKLAEDMDDSQTTLTLVDASYFPNKGTVYINNEIINYNGKVGNILENLTRSATYTNFQAGANRQYTAGPAASHVARTGVILISQTITPLISHWGSAFLTDGGFDEDRGYIFSYSATGINVTVTPQTAFMIRLAPSVSNAIVGNLGERELLNRAQLLLQGLEVTSDGEDQTGNKIQGGIVVEGILNPQNYPVNPGSVGWGGLSSKAQGGQPSFAQIAAGGAVEWSSASGVTVNVTTSADLDSGYVYTRTGLNDNEESNPWSFRRQDFRDDIGSGLPYTAISGITEMYTQNPNSMAPWYVSSIQFNGGQVNNINVVQVSATASDGTSTLKGNDRLQPATTARFVYPAPSGRTDRILVTNTSYLASGITVGTRLAETETKFPGNTSISAIRKIDHSNQTAWLIIFNNTSIVDIAPGQTVEFDAGEASFAEPGETVFSFIAVPGERSTLELESLKELTNTPLGGRGTYPNGPDVLAINIYKASGAQTTANLIIKWGEAQA